MTGLLSRMNSLGPAGKAAHKLAQHMSRALSGSAPSSPSAAAAAASGGGGGGQLSRFNSLLAGSAAGSRPHSAANTPRGTAAAPAAAAAAGSQVAAAAAGGKPPQLSRFAWERPAGVSGPFAGIADGAGSSSRAAQQHASGASSPTAAATGNLSAQTSLTSVLLGHAAAQVAQASAAAGSELPEPDAATWAEQVQRSQQVRPAFLNQPGHAPGACQSDTHHSLPLVSLCCTGLMYLRLHAPLGQQYVCSLFSQSQLCRHSCSCAVHNRLHAFVPLPAFPLLQGICDLQELLDLHRSYVRQASGALVVCVPCCRTVHFLPSQILVACQSSLPAAGPAIFGVSCLPACLLPPAVRVSADRFLNPAHHHDPKHRQACLWRQQHFDSACF